MLRRLVAGLAVAGALTVTACSHSGIPASGSGGGWANHGDLAVRNVVAVADGRGAATLVGTIVNRGEDADRLASITVPGGRAPMAPLEVAEGRLPLGAAGSAAADVARVTLESDRLEPGRVVGLTLNFRQAGPVEVDAPVVTPSGEYENVPMPDDPPLAAGDAEDLAASD